MGKAMKKKKKKGLPEELIEEILVKLPVKSLLRFKCVCKSWYDLIKSSSFINLHLIKHQDSTEKNESIIIIRGLFDLTTSLSFHAYESLSVISPPLELPPLNDNHLKVSGPCNGIISLSNGETVVLCNPATREFKVLPPCLFSCEDRRAFSIRAIGLGFDFNKNSYKVVVFIRLYPGYPSDEDDDEDDYVVEQGKIVCEIYNVSSNSWREIDHDVDIIFGLDHGALFNGASHWIANSKGNHCIVSFGMSTEVFAYMELPYIDPNEGKVYFLMVLNESLALFAYTDPLQTQEQQFVDIWVMHQYGVGKSWTKQFTVGPITDIEYPLLLWKNEAILMESTEGLEISKGELVSCALNTLEMDGFNIHGFRHTLRVMVYQETLVSIK